MKQARTLLTRALILAALILPLSSSIASADTGVAGAAGTVQTVIPEDPGFPDVLPEDPGIN